jgi:hypothetical protein
MCNRSFRGDSAESKGIPSMIVGMILSQKSADQNLVFGGSAVMSGKSTRDENIDTVTFVVDTITLGRDCGISP